MLRADVEQGHDPLTAAFEDRPSDVLLAEILFMGAALLLPGTQSGRSGFINLGTVPLDIPSVAAADL